MKNAISINPLNWKLDETVVITNVKAKPLPEDIAKLFSEIFGPDGRHDNDYTYYYSNIKDNVAKRIATYKTKQ